MQGDCHSRFMKFLSRSCSQLDLLECSSSCPLGFNSSCCEHAILPPRGGSDHHIFQEVCVLVVTSEQSFSFFILCVSVLCGLYKPARGTPTTPQLKQGVATPAMKRKLSHKTVLFLLSQCPISLHSLFLVLLSMALPLSGTGLTHFGWGTDAI